MIIFILALILMFVGILDGCYMPYILIGGGTIIYEVLSKVNYER